MSKAQLTEQRLIEVINVALEYDWPHKDRPCRVDSLRKIKQPDRNWEVESYGTSGPDLGHVPDCDELRQQVLYELSQKYDVLWGK
jgi:hypothetical protein